MNRRQRLGKGDPLKGWGTYIGAVFVAALGILGYLRGDLDIYAAGGMVAGAFAVARTRSAIGRGQR